MLINLTWIDLRITCICTFSDANECDFNNGQCEETCMNTIGSYYCHCDVPNTLDVDERSCTGIYA